MYKNPEKGLIRGFRLILCILISLLLNLLLACGSQTNEAVISDEAVISKASLSDFGPKPLLDELRLQVFRYNVKGLTNHRAIFWVETWKEGQLVPDLTYGFYQVPGKGNRFEGPVQFSILDGSAPEKIRWRFMVAGLSTDRWLEHPFKGSLISGSTW